MLDGWINSIKTMGIFIICAQALIFFKPKGAYEKYIRLLVSAMLLVQLIEPIGSMFGFFSKGEFQERIRSMEQRLMQVQDKSFEIGQDAGDIWSLLLEDAYGQLESDGREEGE